MILLKNSLLAQIILAIIICVITQAGTARLVQLMPQRFFSIDRFPYRCYPWEDQGRIYERLFRVKRWKKQLPDGGGFSRKHVNANSPEALSEHLNWSSRGECSHWLNLLSLLVYPIILRPSLILLFTAYTILSNIPCLIAYRYNLPRIIKLLGLIER